MTNYSICLHLRWLVPLCHCHIKVLVSRAHALPNVQLQGLAEGLAQSRLQGDRRECCQSGGAEGSPPMTAPCPILPLPLQLIKSGGHQPLQGAQPAACRSPQELCQGWGRTRLLCEPPWPSAVCPRLHAVVLQVGFGSHLQSQGLSLAGDVIHRIGSAKVSRMACGAAPSPCPGSCPLRGVYGHHT